MDWEYQTNGPMDPSSPFVQSTKRVQEQQRQQQQQQKQQQEQQQQQRKDVFGSSSTFGAFGQNPLNRTQSTPSQANGLPHTPSQPASIFSTSHLNRTVTAPPFRNPAFTTPRKPFDSDAFSEASPAESSPAATDVSDLADDTPENDRSYDLDHMTITPARHKNMSMNMVSASSSRKQQSGKGELMHTVFSNRDKVRKRKRYNENKDISGYRLPYRQLDEWDETDYDSDESTIEPPGRSSRHVSRGRSPSKNKNNNNGNGSDNKDGWLSNFLSVIQRHPHAPAIMSYWLSTLFNFVVVFGTFYLGWVVWSVLSEDFLLARRKARDGIVAEIERCTASYTQNKCHPIEQRLPAMHQLCDDWYECMLQNENGTKTVQTVILELADVLNSAVGSLHYKTLAVLIISLFLFCYSGTSIIRKAGGGGDMFAQPPPPAYPSSAYYPHPADRIAWEQIAPQTPSRHFNSRHMMRHSNEDTPESDIASPTPPPMSSFRALAPHTPSSSRRLLQGGGSPSKLISTIERNREREWELRERGRSPTKSRSPTKRY